MFFFFTNVSLMKYFTYKHFSIENKLTNIGFHIFIWDGTNFEEFHLVSGNFIKLIALIYEECKYTYIAFSSLLDFILSKHQFEKFIN